MKLDEIYEAAKHVVRYQHASKAGLLAEAVIELLDHAQPCGYEPPMPIRVSDGETEETLLDFGGGMTIPLDDGPAFAVMILRAHERAKEALDALKETEK